MLLVLDRSRPLEGADRDLLRETAAADRVVVINKADRPACWEATDVPAAGPRVTVSLREESDLCDLRGVLAEVLWGGEPLRDTPTLSNLRHILLVEETAAALARAADAADAAAPEELILADLQEARGALEAVTGKRTAEDMLQRIFARFCIGK